MRQIKRIFVHCTASYQATTTEQSLWAEFKAKGWKAPGYHYVVKTDGNIIRMWPEEKVANGVKGYNSTALHVAWIGGIDRQHPYGIDYCEAHNTRCSFTFDDCDDFEPDDDGNDRQPEPTCHLTLIGWYLLTIAIAVLLGWLLTGCTTTEYVTVPEVHEHWHHSTDTIRQTDSIIDRQTTTIREVDSATMARYGIQMKQMQRAWLVESDRLQRGLSELRQTRSDTIHERDSIPYPVEVVKEVARPLAWWEKLLMLLGILFILMVVKRNT